MCVANKLYNIFIDGRLYQARYYNKRTAKKWGKSNGWHITMPNGMWWFDDTIAGMKREILRSFPTARIVKVR